MKVSFLSFITPPDPADNIPYLNAGITDWNLRPRKIEGEPYLQTIEIKDIPFGLVRKMTPEEQSKYKYIINIDGHVSAFRLSLELNMGSVILIVESDYEMWFKNMLKPYIHYVPVKKDLSDLIDQIKWCKEHDDTCMKMIANCKLVYNTLLTKKGILDYLQTLCIELSPNFRYYYVTKPLVLQLEFEKRWLEDFYSKKAPFELFDKEIIIAKTKLTCLKEMCLNQKNVVVKTTDDPFKKSENIHEAFIGIKELNYLATTVPNFATIIGFIPETCSVIGDKICGLSFMTWLNSEQFNFEEYIGILGQITLALEIAQQSLCFVHNDLFPWNVMLMPQSSKNVSCTYELNYNQVIVLTSRIIPVIIDFGKSHIISSGKHFGFVNMFQTNTIQDIVTILISSISIIINRSERFSPAAVIKLINFISNTRFCPKVISSIYELKNFIASNSTFSNLINIQKHDLGDKSPMQFFEYLKTNFVGVHSKTHDRYCKPSISPMVIINRKELPIYHDKAYIYFMFQKIQGGGNSRKDMLTILDSATWTDCIHRTENFKSFKFTTEILFNKQKCKSILALYPEMINICNYIHILKSIIVYQGEYELSQLDKTYILNQYMKFLKSNLCALRSFFADFKTLKFYYNKYYKIKI